jgi:diguanylate cyclase (GGDEF)-like protein
MNKELFKKETRIYVLKVFIIMFIFSMLFFFMFSLVSLSRQRTSEIETISARETVIVESAYERFLDHLQFVTDDLLILRNEFLYDLENSNPFEDVEREWLSYSTERDLYNQIRFIDDQGMEQIRVDRHDGGSYVVSDENLQDKSLRYYVIETLALPDQSIYYSNFDLNIENEVIIEPYELQFRVSTPIYLNDALYGMIVINYDINYLLNEMHYYDDLSSGNFYVIDEDGYYLYNNNPSLLYGFDLSDRMNYNFTEMCNIAWQRISIDNDTQFITDKGLFSISTFSFSSILDANGYSYYGKSDDVYFISMVSQEEIPYFIETNIFWNLILLSLTNNWYVIIFILMLSVIVAVFVYIRLYINFETKQFASIDQLTNIYNRRMGIEQLEKLIEEDNKLSLCFIDLNGLKTINDTYGHQLGDEFIVDTVKIIDRYVKFPDYLFRLGGDEFLIVSHQSEQNLKELWRKIQNDFDKFNENISKRYTLSASHGIVTYDKHMNDVNQFIAAADHKMYEDKNAYYKNKRNQ